MDGRGVPDGEIADEAGDPSAAFDALCAEVKDLGRTLGAEMTVMRKGVEALYDQIDRLGTPIDYGADLGRIVQQLQALTQRVHGIEASPLLHRDPESYAYALERAGKHVFEKTVQDLARSTAEFERTTRGLTEQIESARQRRQQDLELRRYAGFGLLVGLFLGMLALVELPGLIGWGLDLRVAANMLGMSRWDAGIALMRAGDPAGWDWLMDAYKLKQANKAVLTACAEAAAKSKQEQRCTITVAAP